MGPSTDLRPSVWILLTLDIDNGQVASPPMLTELSRARTRSRCAPACGAVARLCASKGPTVLILGRFTQSAFLLRLLITECGDSASVLVDLPLDALLVMFGSPT